MTIKITKEIWKVWRIRCSFFYMQFILMCFDWLSLTFIHTNKTEFIIWSLFVLSEMPTYLCLESFLPSVENLGLMYTCVGVWVPMFVCKQFLDISKVLENSTQFFYIIFPGKASDSTDPSSTSDTNCKPWLLTILHFWQTSYKVATPTTSSLGMINF